MDKEFEKMYYRISDIDEKLRDKFYAEKIEHGVGESFPYIPNFDGDDLKIVLEFCKETNMEFLDVGCGTGRIVKIAKEYGVKATGIEFFAPYVEAGREAFGLSNQELLIMDAFNITREFLKQFRVIYTFMPLQNSDRMTELHFHLYKNAGAPTYFVEMYPMYYPMTSFSESTKAILGGIFSGAAVKKNYDSYARF